MDKYGARAWRTRLRNVLNTVWDPIGIGGGPDVYEYDGYDGKIATLVRSGAADEDIRQCLRWAQTEHMGLGEPDAARLDRTLSAIRALGPIP